LETPQLAESEVPTEPIEKKESWTRFFLDLLETLVLSVALFLGINALTARVLVDGYSMRPTLENQQRLIVNKLAYKSGLPELGDIVVFHFPIDPEDDFIKRVVGLPGDEIKIANGNVSVNGEVLIEPYIAAAPNYAGTWYVPENEVFVLGDNRNNSSDSHVWGAVPSENLIGKAIVIYWPPPAWAMIKHVELNDDTLQ
jgi:signal peptidase I